MDYDAERETYRKALEFIQAVSPGGLAAQIALIAIDHGRVLQRTEEEFKQRPAADYDGPRT